MQIASLKHLHIPVSLCFRSICPGCRRGQKITPQHGMRQVRAWRAGSNGSRELQNVPGSPVRADPGAPGAKTYFAKEKNAKHTHLCCRQGATGLSEWSVTPTVMGTPVHRLAQRWGFLTTCPTHFNTLPLCKTL